MVSFFQTNGSNREEQINTKDGEREAHLAAVVVVGGGYQYVNLYWFRRSYFWV